MIGLEFAYIVYILKKNGGGILIIIICVRCRYKSHISSWLHPLYPRLSISHSIHTVVVCVYRYIQRVSCFIYFPGVYTGFFDSIRTTGGEGYRMRGYGGYAILYTPCSLLRSIDTPPESFEFGYIHRASGVSIYHYRSI
jgi:hypothetical protein